MGYWRMTGNGPWTLQRESERIVKMVKEKYLVALGALAVVGMAGADSAEMRLTGPFGDRLDCMIRNHVEATDAKLLADVFSGRAKEPWWQTEFWGKYMHSAVPFWKYTGSAKLKANIDAGVSRVLASQEGCGYIGNYLEDVRCARGWDVWGMKYTMLGLLHHYDGTGDARSLEAAKRLCDFLIGELGPGGRKNVPLFKTGSWGGLASCSVLETVVWLYNRTNEKRYMDFADYIVRQACSEPDGPQLLAQAGVPVADRRLASAPKEWTPRNWHQMRDLTKAYEMMSCYQGLLEYYEATGKGEYLDAAVKTAESIVATEINLAGGAAARELWYHGREQQVRHFSWQQETCVTITWMRLCAKLLAVTGDPKWADQMERTFYNAYLAALNINCDHFASYTPLAGYKGLGHWHCGMHTDCCNANGPRGYLSMLNAFVSATGDVFTVNFYMSGNARAKLSGGENDAHFEMHTFYPKLDTVNLWYRSRGERTFTLRLRIPAFSSRTSVKVNGKPADMPVAAGSYLDLRRKWSAGDKVELVFDMPVEMHRNGDYVAFTRGPICLARDTRFGDDAIDDDVRAGQITPDVFKSFALVRPPTTDMFMAMSAALPCGCHVENPDAGALPSTVHFTDFASAGNSWQPRDRYQVWLPTLVDIKDEPK